MSVLKSLVRACGQEQLRDAASVDAIDGVSATYVASPRDTRAVSEVMGAAAEHGLAVVVRGAGTKLDWGNPPAQVDLVVDLSAMDAVLEHADGDLIARVQPGVRLLTLQQALSAAHQRLAVDEVVPGSTVGGVIATGLSGPSRLLYGAVRDLLIGITVVRADGVVARAGGRVVKNVAGYDLCKLYTGSYGTLGVVTEAIFRLHPVPETSAYVSLTVSDEVTAGARVADVLTSQVVATAVEIDRPRPDGPVTVHVLIEGFGPGVEARAARLVTMLGSDARSSSERPLWWGTIPSGATVVRLTTQPSGVPVLLGSVARACTETGLTAAMRGSAGTGLLYASIEDAATAPAAVARFVDVVRGTCTAEGGAAVVLKAPVAVKPVVNVWGDIPAISLMRRVKTSFDPDGRLSPGRFVGGI